MLVVHVHVSVQPDRVDDFLTATARNAQASLEEPGVLRFDVLQDQSDPAHVVLVEVYRNADASAAHKATPHYAIWRDTVAEMMARPRESAKFDPVFPTADDHGPPAGEFGSFEFATAGRVIFGAGRAAELPR